MSSSTYYTQLAEFHVWMFYWAILDFYSNNDFRKLCIVTFRSLYRGDTGWIEIYVAMWQYVDKVADVTESQVPFYTLSPDEQYQEFDEKIEDR